MPHSSYFLEKNKFSILQQFFIKDRTIHFRVTDDLIAINDGNEFENHYSESESDLPIRTNFEKEKHFIHRYYFSRPSSLYKRGLSSSILMS